MSRPPPQRRSAASPLSTGTTVTPTTSTPVPQLAPSGAPSNTARTTAIQTTPSTSHAFRNSPLDAILAEQGLARYHLEPPSWRAPWILQPAQEPVPTKNFGRAAALLKPQASVAVAAGTDKDDVDKGRSRPWPVFYPPRDGMDEDSMTEQLVKSGYSAKSVAETFSAHQHIYDKLKTTDVLGNLSRLVAAVRAKAEQDLPSYGPSTFRLPSRITLTDSKREAWFADLASPSVPLSKLSRSVPHGYKGEKGLDMLAHRQVEIGRAVWFVRAFGGIEIQSMTKTRPLSTAIAQYTSEFTTVVCEFVRKQLAEIVLSPPAVNALSVSTSSAVPAAPPSNPSTPTPNPPPMPLAVLGRSRSGSLGSVAQQQAQAAAKAGAETGSRSGGSSGSATAPNGMERGIDIADEDRRKAWESKFEYTFRLIESLYQEALLDQTPFLHFLVTLLESPTVPTDASASLGHLSFALLLLEEYFDDLLQSETATARLVRAGLLRLEEIESLPPSSLSATITTTLTCLIRSAFLSHPDSFVSLLPSPVYPLSSSRTHSPPRFANPSASASGACLEKLLHTTGQDHTIDDGDDCTVLAQTVAADVSELRARRTLAQPPGASGPRSHGDGGALEVDEEALLAAIERLDEIEFPVKMRDVHSALFVTPALRPLASACVGPPIARTVASGAYGTDAQAAAASADSASISGDVPAPACNSTVHPLSLAHAPLLFTWCTTSTRPLPAPHRRYAVSRLIALELERLELAPLRANQSRRGLRSSSRVSVASIEDAFVRWVDGRFPAVATAVSAAGPPAAAIDRRDVRALAEELLRAGVLSYGAYLQRLIARGETEPRASTAIDSNATALEHEESVHLWILRTVALPASGVGVRRRIAANDGEASITRERRVNQLLEVVRRELARLMFSSVDAPADANFGELLRMIKELREEGAHGAVTREMLPEGLSTRLDQATARIALDVDSMAVAVAIYQECGDWWGLFQLLVVLLRLNPSISLLLHIVDVIEGHLDVATTLDSLPELAAALFAAHESLKTNHLPPERRLLALLRRLGIAGHLSLDAKETLETDIRNLASSLTASRLQTQALPVPLAELQSLLVDSSPDAVTQLASTLWFRYHAHPSWSSIALDSVLQMVPQLPPATQGVPSPAAALLRALHDRLPAGLEPVLARWIGAMTTAQLCASFGGPGGTVRSTLLNELVVDGTIGAIAMLKGAVLPMRRALLGLLAPIAAGQLAGNPAATVDMSAVQALQNAYLILSSVILSAPEAADQRAGRDFSPAAFAAEQRLAARRACFGTHGALPAVAASLALLIIQQEVANALALSELANSTGELFVRLGTISGMRTLIVREPAAFKDAMLDSEAGGAMPTPELFRPKLLAGLLLLLKDGGAATPANLVSTEDWDIFLSGLTLWRLSVSKVEVETCLERLELDESITAADKADALHTLSMHFLERVCSSEGQSYLGEQVVRCYKGSASDELVSVAFSRLAEAISTLTSSDPTLEAVAVARTTVRCTSRLLDTLLQSGSATSRAESIDQLLIAARDGYSAGAFKHLDVNEEHEMLLELAHLIAVALRCTRKPAERSTAELYRDCIVPLARQAALLAQDLGPDCELPTLLFDSCSHLLFALSDLQPSLRPPTLQTLLAASDGLGPPLSIEMLPDSTLARITRLFGPYAPTSHVVNPWELLDHTDPSSAASTAVARRSSQHPPPQLVNVGPLDLAAFKARVVETIPAVTALDAVSVSSTTSSAPPGAGPGSGPSTGPASNAPERGAQLNFDFETPCTTLPVAARDHRRTLAISRMLAQRMEQNTANAAAQAQAQAQQVAAAAAAAAAASGSAGRKRAAAVTGADAAKVSGGTPGPPPTSAAAAAAASAAVVAAPTVGRGAKRKATSSSSSASSTAMAAAGAAPEVVVVLDSDDEQASAAPSKAKKAKVGGGPSSATGAAGASAGGAGPVSTTARKTTGGKTASKTTNKRRK